MASIDIKGSGFGCVIAMIALFGVGAYGWVWNIVKVVGGLSDPLTAMIILRMVGIPIWPLGIVLGFC